MVTLLIQGRSHVVPEIAEKSSALLCGWCPGEEGGNAIGEILFGQTNPSGKLSVSIPRSLAQIPVCYNRKDEGPYMDLTAKPPYPFSHGMGYSSFVYKDFNVPAKKISHKDLQEGHRFTVTFSIENQGDMNGKEMAQLYIHDMESCVTRRIKELKDFQKLLITRGSSAKVELSVGLEELCVYDYNMDFVLEPGHVKLMVGSSSELIHFEEIVEILHLS